MKLEQADLEMLNRVFVHGYSVTSEANTKAILALNFPPEDRARKRFLAEKARSGTLTAREKKEIDVYVRVGCLLGMMKSRARRTLAGKAAPELSESK
jgi:hypothetical protein